MNKDLIKKRFAKNIATYRDNADVQRKMAQRLLSYLNKTDFENILEIGCGAGLLTELAAKKLNFNKYIANDIVPECSEYIAGISSDINFVPADIEEFIPIQEQKFDLIISNASFQWFNDFTGVVKKLIAKLSNNGILLFSTFGKENLREISFITGESLPYYSAEEIKLMLKKYNPKVEEEIRIMLFNSPKEVLKHLQLTGVNALESKHWTKQDLKNFENVYNNLCSNHTTLTYNPIYTIIKN